MKRSIKKEDLISKYKHRLALKNFSEITIRAYFNGLKIFIEYVFTPQIEVVTSEIIHLKMSDIDSDRMQIRIHQGKGKKDRHAILSKEVLEMLREYVKAYQPKTFLFEGHNGGKYSASFIQALMKKHTQICGTKKKATPHTLRHSFATHLLDNGTDIRIIQQL